VYHYRAFGRSLHSEVRLPDLPEERASAAHWTLRIHCGERPEKTRLAAEHEIGGESLRVWRTGGGLLFVYDPIGAFRITTDGRYITWFPAAAPVPEHVPAAILGPVLGLAMHAQGVPCLHGSAVSLGTKGVAFLGPKGYGKSTTTAALLEAGAQLITDDTLALALEGIPWLLPGVRSVKLWRDSFREVAPRLPTELGDGAKRTLRGFPSRVCRDKPTRFTAAYVLSPIAPVPGAEVEREQLSAREAALALVANAKVARLLEPAESGLILRAAAEVAGRVPVYSLHIPRSWDHLPKVVAAVLGWHGASVSSPVAMGGRR
jgi:hypothetical protein